jgi:hypothetical protein
MLNQQQAHCAGLIEDKNKLISELQQAGGGAMPGRGRAGAGPGQGWGQGGAGPRQGRGGAGRAGAGLPSQPRGSGSRG